MKKLETGQEPSSNWDAIPDELLCFSSDSNAMSPFLEKTLGALTSGDPTNMTFAFINPYGYVKNMEKQIKEFNMAGIKFKSYVGSERYRLYAYLAEEDKRTFSTVEIAESIGLQHSNISSILNREHRKGNLTRTKRLVYLPGEQNAAHIYTLDKDGEMKAYESYLLSKMKDYPNVVSAYKKVRDGGIHSSVDLHLEFDLLDDFTYLLSFRQSGLIHSVNSSIGWFFYNPDKIHAEDIHEHIDELIKAASETRQKKIDEGYLLEDKINRFLEKHHERVIWKCIHYKKQVMKQIGHKKRFFDFVLYFRPFLKTEKEDVPLKYFSKALIVPVEVKASKRSKKVSGNIVDLHVLESREIWDSVYPVIIGDPTDTGIKALEEFTAGLITLRDLKKLQKLLGEET